MAICQAFFCEKLNVTNLLHSKKSVDNIFKLNYYIYRYEKHITPTGAYIMPYTNILDIINEITAEKHWGRQLVELIAPLGAVTVDYDSNTNEVILTSPKETPSGNPVIWTVSKTEFSELSDDDFEEMLNDTIYWIERQNS